MNSFNSEMKVPIRAAPPPPTGNRSVGPARSTSKFGSREPQGKVAPSNKKKPPPRPPPPNFAVKKDKRLVPTRPSQLITSLFQKKNTNGTSTFSKTQLELNDFKSTTRNSTGFLIDFNSPPSSPTFTTRSSSDCVSVNSFGSDGVTPCSTSSGNTSNVESGFEDDFELVGGWRKDNADPWSLLSQEVAAPRSKNPSPQAVRGGWVSFSSPGTSKKNVSSGAVMPTIIRVKPDRPKEPPNFTKNTSMDLLANSGRNQAGYLDENDEDEEWSSSESPPMPTGPPPAPPPEVLSAMLANGEISIHDRVHPHGLALYDYEGTHPDDLSFKENDRVNLVRRVDANWYVGERNGIEGSVPGNYLRVIVPVGGSRATEPRSRVMYTFQPESWDDLALTEGDVVTVLGRIDHDWLYGECNGRSGQFPATFIDHVPPDLPQRRTRPCH